MNRTGIFLAAAGVLALAAVIAGLPRTHLISSPLTVPLGNPAVASDGALKMSARLSHPYVNLGTSDEFVTVEVSGVTLANSTRAPVNLALVIDRSGSMSGYKLDQAKQAARQLVSQLTQDDRLAIVHFGSDVKSMDGLMATEDNKRRMLSFIDGIWDDGGTNIGSGLTTGRDLLMVASGFKVNRLILISDGQPTEGVTDAESLKSVARQIRANNVSLSSIGVGSDFNEDLMQAFAEIGAGSYGYLADASQLATVFSRDLAQAGTQVARNVTLTFELPNGVRLGEVLGYSSTQVGSTVRVTLPDFSSGQLERIVARVVVNGARSGDSIDVSGLKLDYTDLLKNGFVESTASVSAMVTDKAEVVLQNRDKDAVVFAARARSAWNTENAARALEEGDEDKANKLLQQNAFFFEEAAQVAGQQAVQQDIVDQAELKREFTKPADAPAAAKAAKRKARIDYGLSAHTY